MPNSLQAILVVILFILPGFVAVQADSTLRPVRKRDAFEYTGWTVLLSIAVHALLAIPSTTLLVAWFDLKPDEASFDWSRWVDQQFADHLLRTEFLLILYLVACVALAFALGVMLSRTSRDNVPVWYLETIRRDEVLNGRQALTALVTMKNGTQYSGVIRAVSSDYEVLTRKDRDFSLVRVTQVTPQGEAQTLDEDEFVLLNTADVESMHVAPEPVE